MEFIMDNPKVNRKACQIFEDWFPNMVAFGCQAHALKTCWSRQADCRWNALKFLAQVRDYTLVLSLFPLNQDLKGTEKKVPCPGVSAVLKSVLAISNVIHDSAVIRSELHSLQRTEYEGKIKAITSHSPTRWGALIFIGRDLMKTKVAFRGSNCSMYSTLVLFCI